MNQILILQKIQYAVDGHCRHLVSAVGIAQLCDFVSRQGSVGFNQHRQDLPSSLGESDPTLKTLLLGDRDRFLVVKHAQWLFLASRLLLAKDTIYQFCLNLHSVRRYSMREVTGILI